MKSHYQVDQYKFTTEVVEGCNIVQVLVKRPYENEIIHYNSTSWNTIKELLPEHLIRFIEEMIQLDTEIFIKKTPSLV